VIDPYMPLPMDEDLPDPDGFLGEDAAASGATTPLWPPPDATLADLGVWLDSLRSLPPDDAILARAQLLETRMSELRAPPPVERATLLTRLLRAQQLTAKRRRQLKRFEDMRDCLADEVAALEVKMVDAVSTIRATASLVAHAETAEHALFCEYSASREAPGRFSSPDAADPASAEAARRRGRDPDVAAGVCGIITQLLSLPSASHANIGVAHAAILKQARLVHAELTGNPGPTLEPALPAQSAAAASGGGFAPRMAWAAGSPCPDATGGPTLTGGTAHAAAGGQPVSFGGYAVPGSGLPDPTPAEAGSSAGRKGRPSPIHAN